MPKFSLKKTLAIVAVIIALTHLPQIVHAIEPVYEWFCDSLSVIREFPHGMQAAIAMGLLVLAFVTITNFRLKK